MSLLTRVFFFLLLIPPKACPKTSNFCLLTRHDHRKEGGSLSKFLIEMMPLTKRRGEREHSLTISLTWLVPMVLMEAKGLRAAPCFSHCVSITLKRLIQSALIAFHLPNEA